MLFLEEIWSRNFTNLFIAPLKIKEIIVSLIFTALIRTLIGLSSSDYFNFSFVWSFNFKIRPSSTFVIF